MKTFKDACDRCPTAFFSEAEGREGAVQALEERNWAVVGEKIYCPRCTEFLGENHRSFVEGRDVSRSG